MSAKNVSRASLTEKVTAVLHVSPLSVLHLLSVSLLCPLKKQQKCVFTFSLSMSNRSLNSACLRVITSSFFFFVPTVRGGVESMLGSSFLENAFELCFLLFRPPTHVDKDVA